MVHLTPVHFTPSPLFQIRLQDSTLTMLGSQTESVGCVLRGQLVLALTEPTKFKEIKLTFQGRSKISWVDGAGKGQFYHEEERILYHHDWTFLPAGKQYHVLKPDNYHWDFELVLPGTLPETIEGCQHGNVSYMLKAVATRHAFAVNLHTQRKVTLLRSLSPSSLECLQSSFLANTWSNRAEYEFSTNATVFGLGDKISVAINLKSLEENLKVQSIYCMLKEYVTYKVGTSHKTESKTISIVNEENFSQQVDSWDHLMEIPIPSNALYCLYDSENDAIRIKHKLKFYVKFVNHHRNCELRAALPIVISSVSLDSDIMALPAYHENENYFERSYFEDNYLGLSRHNSNSSLSSLSSSPSSSRSSFDEPLFEIEELSKLPSYRSIASHIPAPLADFSLPPTYDASISSH